MTARRVWTLVPIALLVGACSTSDGEPVSGGQALYRANCSACHADDGSGATGPALGGSALAESITFEETVSIVRDGRSGMPAYRDQLTTAEIESVVEYIRAELGTEPDAPGT